MGHRLFGTSLLTQGYVYPTVGGQKVPTVENPNEETDSLTLTSYPLKQREREDNQGSRTLGSGFTVLLPPVPRSRTRSLVPSGPPILLGGVFDRVHHHFSTPTSVFLGLKH